MAVIGVGWAGTRQLTASQHVDGLEVVAVVDPDLKHAGEVAAHHGIERIATDINEVLDDESLDLVSICSPHMHHHSQTIRALEAGKHVICEKPLALNKKEGIEMVACERKSGRRLFVAESEVFRNLTRSLVALVEKQAIGEISSVSVNRGFSALDFGYEGRRSWLTDPVLGGTGTWMLHGVHTVAQIRAIFGEIHRIFLVESRTEGFTRTDIEATVSGVLVTSSGLPVTLIQTSESPLNRHVATHRVHGSDGVIVGNERELAVTRSDDGSDERHRLRPDGIDPYVRELEAFIAYIETGIGSTTGESELATLQVVEAGYESVRSGQAIEIPEIRSIFPFS